MDERLDVLLSSARPAFPPTPDLVPGVMAGLRARRVEAAGRPRLRLALVAALLVSLLAAGAVAAGALGIGPLRVLFGEALPSITVPDTPLGARLALGRPVAVSDAEDVAGLELLVPQSVGAPDEAYLSDIGIVSLVWRADDDLQPLSGSGIGLLVMAIPGDLDPSLVSKIVVESRATVEPATVRREDGYWISGAPHVLRYLLPDQGEGVVMSRLVGDALVWQEGGTVFRIESGLGRDATLDLADSLVPMR
jgi:hypothetical protein